MGFARTSFSSEEPERLRGPQFHIALCDELAAWRNARTTWDNLQLGLRLGKRPQTFISTTPKPIKLLKEILADPNTVVRKGTTYDNRENLAPVVSVTDHQEVRRHATWPPGASGRNP